MATALPPSTTAPVPLTPERFGYATIIVRYAIFLYLSNFYECNINQTTITPEMYFQTFKI